MTTGGINNTARGFVWFTRAFLYIPGIAGAPFFYPVPGLLLSAWDGGFL